VDRSPYALAALASTLPGIEPVGVQQVPNAPENEFVVAFVQDRTDRRWVVRSPRTPAAAARMEAAITLLGLLSRRVTFSVPAPRGLVELKEGGRAAVYPYLPGRNVDFAKIPAGRGVAVEIGRTLAALHNVDPALYDEAGAPVYDADEVLVSFDDPEDVTSAKVRGLTGWEDARVGDPADDFASLVAECSPEALESVMEAYSHARIERPDANLLVRARLASEMALLAELQRAITAGWDEAVEAHSAALRRLDDEVNALADAENDYKRTSLDPVKPRSRQTPPPLDYAEDESEEELPGLDDEEPTPPAGPTGDATEVIDLRDPDTEGDEPGDGVLPESTLEPEQAPGGAVAVDDTSAERSAAGDVRPHAPEPDPASAAADPDAGESDESDEPDDLDPMYRCGLRPTSPRPPGR
jgi:aminoglycoside phosphotransferase (APT) family kinase protein